MGEYCRTGQATNGNMAHAHCMLDIYGYKYARTHTGCVILIAFPLQQWLHEQASMLRYTYIGCLVPIRLDCESRHNVRRTFRSIL
jgi:hypothetical protein